MLPSDLFRCWRWHGCCRCWCVLYELTLDENLTNVIWMVLDRFRDWIFDVCPILYTTSLDAQFLLRCLLLVFTGNTLQYSTDENTQAVQIDCCCYVLDVPLRLVLTSLRDNGRSTVTSTASHTRKATMNWKMRRMLGCRWFRGSYNFHFIFGGRTK